MQRIILFCCILISQFGYSQRSQMDKGYVIYTLGTDTTFVGYYQWQDNKFHFKVMGRPNLSVTIMNGMLYPNGELKEATGYSYKPTGAGDHKRLIEYNLYTDNESTFIRQIRDGKETLQKYSGKAMMINALGTPFLYFLPVLANYAPTPIGRITESNHFVLAQNRKFTIKRLASDVLEMGSNIMGYFKVYLHPNGKIKSIDGVGSSWNVKGNVFDELDFDSYVQRFVQKEETEPLKPLNTKDSVVTLIGGADVRVDYWRPSKRGRVIFGAVVPWNRVWRTGANEPTKLSITKAIYFNGKELPAGQYSIFTLPAKKQWMLIINKQTNIWGTDHDAAHDIMRVPMKTSTVKDPLELMTIEITGRRNKGVLSVSWDKTKAWVPFTVK